MKLDCTIWRLRRLTAQSADLLHKLATWTDWQIAQRNLQTVQICRLCKSANCANRQIVGNINGALAHTIYDLSINMHTARTQCSVVSKICGLLSECCLHVPVLRVKETLILVLASHFCSHAQRLCDFHNHCQCTRGHKHHWPGGGRSTSQCHSLL